jgi:tripartite-type tricarboxylate transporter receptor subunit TctC
VPFLLLHFEVITHTQKQFMRTPKISIISVKLAIALVLNLIVINGFAQTSAAYPTKPIRLIIPFPVGGATDIIARLIAQRLSSSLAQNVIVENKPGAGGAIGADFVAKASNDGYTLLLATSSTHSIGPVLNTKMPYDANKDFASVGIVATAPSVLVVGAASPLKTAKELIETVKANPGKFNYGSSGIGTYPHLAGEMFKWRAGNLYAVHIPYRGTGLVIPDLIGGQITFLMDSIVSAQTHIKDGKVRALGVSGTKRSSSLPSVPTFSELGVAGMEVSNWFGMFAPANTSDAIVNRLNTELNLIMKTPDMVERLEKLGAEVVTATPAQFSKIYRDEAQTWKAVIQRANIKPE